MNLLIFIATLIFLGGLLYFGGRVLYLAAERAMGSAAQSTDIRQGFSNISFKSFIPVLISIATLGIVLAVYFLSNKDTLLAIARYFFEFLLVLFVVNLGRLFIWPHWNRIKDFFFELPYDTILATATVAGLAVVFFGIARLAVSYYRSSPDSSSKVITYATPGVSASTQTDKRDNFGSVESPPSVNPPDASTALVSDYLVSGGPCVERATGNYRCVAKVRRLDKRQPDVTKMAVSSTITDSKGQVLEILNGEFEGGTLEFDIKRGELPSRVFPKLKVGFVADNKTLDATLKNVMIEKKGQQ